MSVSVTVPEGFQYVGASMMSTVFVLVGQSLVVSKYRKLAGIKYPQLYADKAEAAESKNAQIFNCAQRAHQNTLENLPVIYLTTIIAGLKYPIFAATGCLLFTIGRISYTAGYISGDPSKRATVLYRVSAVGLLGLLLASTYTAGGWVFEGLSKLL